jgi:NCS2 family nucleobase:cation symporter-2
LPAINRNAVHLMQKTAVSNPTAVNHKNKKDPRCCMSELSKARIPDAPAIQRLPLLQLILVGLQHVLLMYGGAIAVPLIIGQAAGLSREEIAFLINADLLVAGIATIVQSLGIGPVGIRMPVMMGASFAAVGSMVAMAGMPASVCKGSSARPSPPVSSAC